MLLLDIAKGMLLEGTDLDQSLLDITKGSLLEDTDLDLNLLDITKGSLLEGTDLDKYLLDKYLVDSLVKQSYRVGSGKDNCLEDIAIAT
jgi:hypothetical protein